MMMIIIQQILKFCRYIYFVVSPLAYLSYIFYIRVILDRPLRDITLPLSNLQLFFIFLAIFILLLRIKSLLILEELITPKEQKNIILLKINNIAEHISYYIDNVLQNCYDLIVGIRLRMYFFLLKFVKSLYKIPFGAPTTIIILSLEILPKIIVVCCFLIDIFIFQQLFYFYKVLCLLLLPLFARIIKFRQQHVQSMIDLLTSEPLPGTDFDLFCFIDPTTRYEFIRDIDDFIDNHFYPIYDLFYLRLLHNRVRVEYHLKKIELFISILYLIGWTTILFFGIHLY